MPLRVRLLIIYLKKWHIDLPIKKYQKQVSALTTLLILSTQSNQCSGYITYPRNNTTLSVVLFGCDLKRQDITSVISSTRTYLKMYSISSSIYMQISLIIKTYEQNDVFIHFRVYLRGWAPLDAICFANGTEPQFTCAKPDRSEYPLIIPYILLIKTITLTFF